MNRRDMLKASLAGLGTALASDAEAATGEDTSAAVARVRRRLKRTQDLELAFLQIPEAASAADHERAAIDETLIRSAMRTLLVAGAVMDLGEEVLSHPDVQGLLTEVAPEMDHAVEGALLRLQTLPRADRRRVNAELKRNPAIVEDVALELEKLASKGGPSVQRRFHLRSLLQQVTWRLTHQPLDAVIGDAVEKTQAQAALMRGAPGPSRSGAWADATVRLRTAFDGEPEMAVSAGDSDDDAGSAGPSERVRHLRLRAGTEAIIGVGLGVSGALLVTVGSGSGNPVIIIGGLILLTGAVVMLVLALVVVIVAAVLAARGDSADEVADEPRAVEEERAEEEPPGVGTARRGERILADLMVSPTGSWVPTGVHLEVSAAYIVRAGPMGSALALAAGDLGAPAGADAPAPGRPLGAVVGRINGTVWSIGAEWPIVGVEGDLEVAVNLPSLGDGSAVQTFRVAVSKLT